MCLTDHTFKPTGNKPDISEKQKNSLSEEVNFVQIWGFSPTAGTMNTNRWSYVAITEGGSELH